MFGGRGFPRIHDRAPILSFIRGELDAGGCLPDPGCALPDEKPSAPGKVGWLAGALESPDRGPVTVGIALSASPGALDGSLLHQLGDRT